MTITNRWVERISPIRALALGDWHAHDQERLRVPALRYRHHAHLLGEIAYRLSRRIDRLPPGAHPTRCGVAGVWGGSAYFVAAQVVLAREEERHHVHHATRFATLPHRVMVDGIDRYVAYADGTVLVPDTPEERHALERLVAAVGETERARRHHG